MSLYRVDWPLVPELLRGGRTLKPVNNECSSLKQRYSFSLIKCKAMRLGDGAVVAVERADQKFRFQEFVGRCSFIYW